MAKKALSANLSGRKFVDLDGPHGLDHACVPLGRLSAPEVQNGTGVKYGVHRVLPLVETRVSFGLRTAVLEDIERGARDVSLDAVVEGCRKIAQFEEKALFDGFEPGGIVGLQQAMNGARIQISPDRDAVVDAVSEAQARMMKDGVAGPANLVVSAPLWKFLAHSVPGGTLRSLIENQIGGRVIYAQFVKDALLIAGRGGDAELTLGQDFAIGYQSHTASEISLFITESFTFRVIAPEAVVGFALA